MIEYRDGIFHIAGSDTSYLMGLTPGGQLKHIAFGSRVALEDAAALACKPGLGWGSAVLYSRGDPSSCLDVLPLEWSGAGRGDYRESPFELATDSGAAATDFRYVRHEIYDGAAQMKSGLPQAQSGGETLEIILEDAEISARLTLYYTLFGEVITRRAALRNLGEKPLYIHKIMSMMLDLPGDYDITTFTGAWNREANKTTHEIGFARTVNDSVTGFSSNRNNPGFLISRRDAGEDRGRVYGFNLVYSGNHYSSAQKSAQGLNRVMQGISPANFRYKLAAGQTFETPEAVMATSNAGFNGLSHIMHGFINSHIVPARWQYRERPVLYNDWEGCMFSFDEGRLLSLARRAKRLGCELFVLDDGWFGDRNSDTAGLGDYRVNRQKLPSGIDGLAKKIRGLGMDFGLWFEPEAVNEDSDLYRAHPDWVLENEGRSPVYGRNELLLDLTKPEVRDYIVTCVCAVLDSAEISYVKWDMNRHSPALGAASHDYILGLYEILHRIFDPRPDILLETCSSGGNRFDLGMLCFSPQIWASDDTDPVERLDIQRGLSYLYPQSAMGCHVSASPHSQTLRRTPLNTRANVAFFGCLGYELDLSHLVPVEEREIKRQIEFYKEHRYALQFGSFSRLNAPEGCECWQVMFESTALVGLFRRLSHAAPGYETLRLSGLCPEKRYKIISRPQPLRVSNFGGLINFISPVKLHPQGSLLRRIDRAVTMPDSREEYTATGAALMDGVVTSGRFNGAGYDGKQRMQCDFGSNLYIVKEEHHD